MDCLLNPKYEAKKKKREKKEKEDPQLKMIKCNHWKTKSKKKRNIWNENHILGVLFCYFSGLLTVSTVEINAFCIFQFALNAQIEKLKLMPWYNIHINIYTILIMFFKYVYLLYALDTGSLERYGLWILNEWMIVSLWQLKSVWRWQKCWFYNFRCRFCCSCCFLDFVSWWIIMRQSKLREFERERKKKRQPPHDYGPVFEKHYHFW